MNTELMLRIAHEIESRPEGYDQVNGVFQLHRESECAGNYIPIVPKMP